MAPIEPALFVLGDLDQGQISPTTWEGLGLAEEIRRHHPAPVKIILLGEDVGRPAAQAVEEFRVDVLAVEGPGLKTFQEEIALEVLQELFFESPPAFLILPNNSRGWELAPRIALRMGTGLHSRGNKGSLGKTTVSFSGGPSSKAKSWPIFRWKPRGWS